MTEPTERAAQQGFYCAGFPECATQCASCWWADDHEDAAGPAVAALPQEDEWHIGTLLIKLRAADEMARVCDDWVVRKVIDERSALADARLDYGDPYKYEFSNAAAAPQEAAPKDRSFDEMSRDAKQEMAGWSVERIAGTQLEGAAPQGAPQEAAPKDVPMAHQIEDRLREAMMLLGHERQDTEAYCCIEDALKLLDAAPQGAPREAQAVAWMEQPEGWVSVPREPTPEMWDQAENASVAFSDLTADELRTQGYFDFPTMRIAHIVHCYRAMLAALPASPEGRK